jgi:branched-chain amino acid transport system permease protein
MKHLKENHRKNQILSLAATGVLLMVLSLFNAFGSDYQVRILNNCAIFIALAVSYNLINGVTGQFSLGPNAFLAIGAYTSALLTLSPLEKEMSFIIVPLIWPLSEIQMPFIVSLFAAGFVAAFFAFLMAFPVFRVRGDYLAIVTLGFGEVIRVVANNTQSVTNGPLGLKGIANYTNLWWSWGFAMVTIFLISRLVRSSYGRALKAIRSDETAAEAIGINTFWHKMLAFTISAFFTGVGGGLLAHLITTISPTLFSFFLTFNLLIMIVIGGLGSTTGAFIAAVLVTWGGELLRIVEEPIRIGTLQIPGIPGMRMVIFSFALILLMIFARGGLMGAAEFSWDGLFQKLRILSGKKWRAN